MKKIICMLLIFTVVVGCSNRESKLAQKNIKHYMLDKFKEGVSITKEEYSKLYIITPKDESNIPKWDTTNIDVEDVEAFVKQFGKHFDLYGTPLSLSLEGCTNKCFDGIVENDHKFREWKTGGKEFVMIGFFSLKDKYLDHSDVALCFRLDSTLKVYKPYLVKDEQYVRKIAMESKY